MKKIEEVSMLDKVFLNHATRQSRPILIENSRYWESLTCNISMSPNWQSNLLMYLRGSITWLSGNLKGFLCHLGEVKQLYGSGPCAYNCCLAHCTFF